MIVLRTRVTRTLIEAQIPVPVLFTQLNPLTMQARSCELRSRLLYFHTLCNLASSAISKHHDINMKRSLYFFIAVSVLLALISTFDIDFSGVNSVYSTSVCSPLDPTCVMTKYVNQCLLNKDEFFKYVVWAFSENIINVNQGVQNVASLGSDTKCSFGSRPKGRFHEKTCRSFGFCPNEGGRALLKFFVTFSYISAFLVNKRSLFPSKCHLFELWTFF